MSDLDENKTPEAIIAEAMVSAGAPLMHSRVEESVAGALRKAGMLAEQSGQVCAWCPSPARGSAHHNDGKLHPSCGQVSHGQGWVPDYPVERIGAIEAERDAALAEVERVRQAEALIAEAANLHRPTLPGFGPKSCTHDGRAWPCPDSIALGLNEGARHE